MEERILTIKDDLIAETLESLRKASRKANRLMDDYKPVLHGERLMTDGELATVLRIRMKGNILYKESDIEKVIKTHEHKEINL